MNRRSAFAMIPLLSLLLFISGCSNGTNSPKKESETQAVKQNTDTTLLFNGIDLEGWEVTNFGPQGPVSVSGDQLILGMGDGCTGVTWKKAFPRFDYEVTLEAKRVSGVDFFCGITFPVDKSPCTLIVGGWGGGTVGLSSIDGKDASENETTSIRNFETNRWYHIRLTVSEGSIKALIDDEKVVDFTIGNKKLSIRPEVELSKPFGIASWKTTAALRNIHLKRIEK